MKSKNNHKNKNQSNETLSVKKDDSILSSLSSKAVIIILTLLIFILLTYIIASRYIEKKSTEQNEAYLALTTEYLTEEHTTSEIRVNINTDDIYELTLLEGIGKAKAEAIIEYRKENGDFVSIEEIKNVTGIGDAIFEKIKDFIYVEVTQ